MVALIAYVIVLGVAALLTFQFFGGKRGGGAPGDCSRGLGFFYPAGSRGRRRPLDPFLLSMDAPQAELLSFLQETCCVLPVRGESVRMLLGPTEFFEELQKRVRAARRSIVMSALYVGDGPLARQFVACLESKVEEAARAGRPFDICLLLDHNRMNDRHNLRTLKQLLTLAHTTSGATGVDNRALVRVRLSLFQTPSRWNRLFAPFGRVKEALGVQHTKIFCFDGHDTILTGANLSDDYFSTRMDRYVLVEDNARVAAWFSDLVQTLCRMSYRVVCRNEFASGCHVNSNNDGGNTHEDKTNSNNNNNNGGGGGGRISSSGLRTSKLGDGPTLHKKSDLVVLPNTAGLDPSLQSAAFSVHATQLLEEFAARAVAAAEALPPETDCDTFLFPTVQWAGANVFHDSLVVQQLLHKAPSTTRIYLTSPYLNLYSQFVDEMLASETRYEFITASVTTNGWRGAKGFAGYIPYFYLQLERAFYYLTREYGCSDRVRVREFGVGGLTFHAKGVWFVEEEEEEEEKDAGCADACEAVGKGVKAPYLVAYGSTNYGYRSVHKDVEAEVFLFTANNALREALRNELLFLLRQVTLVTEERFVRGAQGSFQPVVSLLAQMGQDFL
ncbi:putative phosphatidylglycerophosphate synthase [Trypanosoma rangeli]|uniref:CDP-diacylglycerol--glycerol-3-phosphate 3-phosphatidyltransferase n=1 Tax=Trypanosoma rangeli TaxID=5698 RepID=A0A3R7KSA0_TRYRA|nr:putative phosphatidylglycerophosphate synthase [Trypanosoma rangeli]RNF08677.1 putative phosphatidylglycerophosphate synthase [Trypanosoma rangeli]|eukprot:RNF08677.1 putative phosphatidylglycerophosphate synthase [Trypanosoma rangeli]